MSKFRFLCLKQLMSKENFIAFAGYIKTVPAHVVKGLQDYSNTQYIIYSNKFQINTILMSAVQLITKTTVIGKFHQFEYIDALCN